MRTRNLILDKFLQQVDDLVTATVESNCNGKLLQIAKTHFQSKGKMLRPKVIYHLGRVFNVTVDDLVPWAACCELLHNATLVHDDLQDGDLMRRGKPTIWKQFGPEQAINLGDFLIFMAPQTILNSELEDKVVRQLCVLFSQTSNCLVNGQSLEFELNKFKKIDSLESDYLDCITKKTSALFSGVALGVAVMAGASDETKRRIDYIFNLAGRVFQMQDDILDLFGDKNRGEVGCDIKEGKVSLIIVKHLANHPEDYLFTKTILLKKRDETTIADIERFKELVLHKNTLNEALLDLHATIDLISNDKFLLQNPALYNNLMNLLDEFVQPINHLQPLEIDYCEANVS